MSKDQDDREGTRSTTFTFNSDTDEFLKEAYPDAIGTSERIRAAINDARKVHGFFASGGVVTNGGEEED